MKKLINILKVLPETIVAYAVFGLLMNKFNQLFPTYKMLSVIPFITLTYFIVQENRKELNSLNQQG